MSDPAKRGLNSIVSGEEWERGGGEGGGGEGRGEEGRRERSRKMGGVMKLRKVEIRLL